MKRPLDPDVVDFVKALARANAARDIARRQQMEGSRHEQPEGKRAASSR
ncbi:MAG: hypothetical protein H6916_04120 [Novosphingobium sp.]|nr:hypothetical protein [Novosphingobium sp.]MCP5385988.1 hypothetical protein [Novosphingobium sp.]